MGSRKTTAQREAAAAEAGRATIEERRERILSSISKLDDDGILRVDWLVRGILEDDPVLMSMASAPVEDEPESEEERRAVEEAMKEVEAGHLIPHEEARRQLLGDR